MNDTPRTNAMLTAILETHGHVGFLNCPPTWVAFARELERELNRACEMYRKLDIHALNLVDRIRRLEEAGDRMEKLLPDGSICDKAANEWLKAKEAKP